MSRSIYDTMISHTYIMLNIKIKNIARTAKMKNIALRDRFITINIKSFCKVEDKVRLERKRRLKRTKNQQAEDR